MVSIHRTFEGLSLGEKKDLNGSRLNPAEGKGLNIESGALGLFMKPFIVDQFQIDLHTIDHLPVISVIRSIFSLRNDFIIPSGMFLVFVKDPEFVFGLS